MEIRNRITALEYVHTRNLTAHPGNWREHPKAQADALLGVLKEVGIAGALLAYRSERQGGALVVIDGHLRKDAAPTKWPVLILDVTDEEADYLLATHDPLAAMATADAGALDALLSSVNSGEAAVQAMLAELAESAGLYPPTEDESDAESQIDRAEELREQWGVEPGQMWRLPSRTPGQEHRLICGDCTDAAVVERVMGGEKAGAVVTDPPYAVFGSSTGIGKNITDDKMILPFCREVYRIACDVTPTNAHVYIHCDWKSFNAWWSQLDRFDLRPLNCIVWDKGDGGIGTNYTNKHEFILFLNREPKQTTMTGGGGGMRLVHGIANVQRFNATQGKDRQHNAAKPVDLEQVFIGASTDVGDIVAEPFSGSGTTIIAAENLSRQCRAVEISPAYVAVALQRYADAFHIEPELITDGD